ncbi:MAG: cyclic nucleotide-binding domain-containing protein [Planctomycetota bacterium]
MGQHYFPKDRNFAPNEVILCEEAVACHLYIIKRGRVRVSKKKARGGDVVLGELGAGNLFGEMALVDHRLRCATVTAIDQTHCVELPYQLVNDQLDKAGPWVTSMLRILVLRLRAADEAFAEYRQAGKSSGEIPVDAATQRHLNKIVKKIEDTQAIESRKLAEYERDKKAGR